MKKTILPLILSVGLSACGSFNSAPSGISGSVTRQAAVTPPNDGKGVLYIAALAQCDHAEKPLAVKVLADADLSSDMSGVPFQLPEINQSVYLAAFLDDNGDADLKQPLPGRGDLAYGSNSADGKLDCIAASPGQPVTIPLNLNH